MKTISPKKKVALITGASRGFGYEICKSLSNKNFHIIAIARTVGGLEDLYDEINSNGGEITLIPLDLKEDVNIKNLTLQIYDKFKQLDILIHSAAMSSPFTLTNSIETKEFQKYFNVNTLITLSLIRNFDLFLKNTKNSKFIYIDDKFNGKFNAIYSASKSASREIVNSYAKENKRLGPKVIIHNPLPMPTNLRKKFFPGESSENLSSCKIEAEKLIQKLFAN
tara:strand:+ start:547 stop:1215 length:669 start_codon:yes stop_codon:yes gene_type:complete